jgi:hypothetical protein
MGWWLEKDQNVQLLEGKEKTTPAVYGEVLVPELSKH